MSEPGGHWGLGTRFRAAIRGEQSAQALETMRRAGVSIYGEFAEAETARTNLAAGADGGDVWTATAAVGGHLLASWNAFVLQALGEALLDADYATDPGTAGYVPPVTFEQAWSWLATAAEWLSIARQARANPGYDPRDQFHLPADPPAFVDVKPLPRAHLGAMLAAIPPIREYAELAMFDLDKCSRSDDRRRLVDSLRQMAAEAAAATEYAADLGVSAADRRLHEYIEAHLRRALVLWFHIGQLAAMPSLIATYEPGPPPVRVDPAALPRGPSFDPWCLTDPDCRDQFRSDRRARRGIEAMWATDPDPIRTLAIQAEIDQALAAKQIVRASKPGAPGYYHCCPWSSIYVARRSVRIGGRPLSAAQQFTFDVSGEMVPAGGAFVRQILTGPFHVTNDIEYYGHGSDT